MKRADVVPGVVLEVRAGKTLSIDPHMYLFGKSWELPEGAQLVVVTPPRKKDNINLVRVKLNQFDEHECFYCDILTQCQVG